MIQYLLNNKREEYESRDRVKTPPIPTEITDNFKPVAETRDTGKDDYRS